MQDNTIYQDIAKVTGGDIYVGVVGPVRSGKSTFIRKFLDSAVIPNIENEYDRQRTQDELPQSASGKTVMTTEPKFVPGESVRITIDGATELNVKMIDCVGYMVEGALGGEEGGEERMVMTPWSDEPMPFKEAAELGTGKVIGEHSTIGILVTTDGSITDIPRENYVAAEERVARELSMLGKPFAIILNSKNPGSENAIALAKELEKKYGVPVALVSVTELDSEDVREILGLVLNEFPMRTMTFDLPDWTEILEENHPIMQTMIDKISEFSDMVSKIGDVSKASGCVAGIVCDSIDAGDGTAHFSMPLPRKKYYETISELTGLDIDSERELFKTVLALADTKRRYEKFESALRDVEEKGYGIVMPTVNEVKLDTPQLVKQSGGYGVKVTASADSIHMIKAGIKAELCPVVGSEEQSEKVVRFLTDEMEENPSGVWECNMFGRSLYDLVSDGMTSKLSHIPDESREKLGETLGKIVNEGSNGLICILL